MTSPPLTPPSPKASVGTASEGNCEPIGTDGPIPRVSPTPDAVDDTVDIGTKSAGVEDENEELEKFADGGLVGAVADPNIMRRTFLKASPILGTELCERLAYYGIATNIVVYLTQVLNESNAKASEDVNAWSGVCYISPLVGAWIADTYTGRFKTILSFSCIYLAGLTLLTISAGAPSLVPEEGVAANGTQLGVFWTAMYLVAVGTGGIKPCVSTFGADQFDESKPEELALIPRFYNWFYAFINIGSLVATTAIVIIQTDVSWMVGFLIPCISFALAIVIFLVGYSWYKRKPPGGSPINRWCKVLFSSCLKWKLPVPEDARLLHEVDTPMSIVPGQLRLLHTPRMKFLDKAATLRKHPGEEDKWLVTVTEVEEFKCVVSLLPFMSILTIYWAIYSQMSTLFVLQGSAMDRNIGSWTVPAAMVNVLDTISVLFWAPVYDMIIAPYFERIGRPISRLARMGIGFGIAIIAMICAAAVEVVRLQIVDRHNLQDVDPTDNSVPMSVWWQIPQYFFIGMSEVFTAIGSLEFFYSQSPEAMRSMAAALNLLCTAFGSYLAMALVAIIQAITTQNGSPGWIADNLNQGHLDYFFWTLAVIMFIGILFYIPICYYYQYRQDPSVGYTLMADADREQMERILGKASVSAPMPLSSQQLSTVITSDHRIRRVSAMFPVHADEIALRSIVLED